MDVPASPGALPELNEALGAFQVCFRRPEGRQALVRWTMGLLPERPHQHGAPVAHAMPGSGAPRLQACLPTMPWEEEDRNRPRVPNLSAEAPLGEGVLVLDDTGVVTHGQHSLGVVRQCSGILGPVGDGQMAVTGCEPNRGPRADMAPSTTPPTA